MVVLVHDLLGVLLCSVWRVGKACIRVFGFGLAGCLDVDIWYKIE